MDLLNNKHNEYDTILFEDYKIYTISNHHNDYVKDDDDIPNEWLLEEEPDIYSNNHPWDATQDFFQYISTNCFFEDDTIYVPKRFLYGKNIPKNSYKIISNHDRFDPVCYF